MTLANRIQKYDIIWTRINEVIQNQDLARYDERRCISASTSVLRIEIKNDLVSRCADNPFRSFFPNFLRHNLTFFY